VRCHKAIAGQQMPATALLRRQHHPLVLGIQNQIAYVPHDTDYALNVALRPIQRPRNYTRSYVLRLLKYRCCTRVMVTRMTNSTTAITEARPMAAAPNASA
jgi:hypothetical protein